MRKSIAILVLCLLCAPMQGKNYYGKKIGIESGLSQSFVTAVSYDNSGSLWIGTRNGLNEYRNGKVRNIQGEISNARITGLLCDEADKLWVSTDRGVFYYDRNSDSFTEVSKEPSNCICEKDGFLFIGVASGLLKYCEADESLTGTNELRDVQSIYSYGDDILCVSTSQGVEILKRNGSVQKLDIPQIEGKTVFSQILTGDRLALSLLGEGLLIYNVGERRVEGLYRPCDNGNGRELIASLQIINGDLWLGTDGDGIKIMNLDSGEIRSFNESHSLLSGTEIPESVTCMYQDPVGNVWIGGVYSGVIGLKPTAVRTCLSDEIVNTLYFSEDDKLYIGTDGDGISILEAEDGSPIKVKACSGMKITSLTDYDKTRILFCAYNYGLFLLNRKTLEITPFTLIDKETSRQECLFGNAPEVCTMNNGNILIFARHNYIHNPKTGSFKVIDSNEAKELHVVTGKGGDRFTYTWTGVFAIQNEGAQLRRLLYSTKDSGFLYALSCTDRDLFYGAAQGLFHLDPKTGESEQIKSSLFSRVTELCAGENGYLWIGADNALFLYKKGTFELVGEDYGVPANEYLASTHAWGNSVYLGGTAGLIGIHDPDNLLLKKSEKQVHLHSLSVNGKNTSISGNSIQVQYNYESIDLSISLSGFDPLEKVAYRYTVNGLNSYTVETFDDHLQLPTLKAGKYDVKVSYLMDGGVWSTPGTVLNIRVRRAWYGSTLMLCLYSLLGIAILIAGALYERKRILSSLQISEKEKDEAFINEFTRYVQEHISDNNLGVDSIADAMKMSRSSLYAKVKESLDIGIGEYIDARRLDMAKELLRTTDLTVTEISEKTGYSTPRYFSTRFKVLTGETPITFRKRPQA